MAPTLSERKPRRLSAITRWNRRVLQRISTGAIKRHVVGLLYPMGGGRARLIRIPADSPFSGEPGSNIWAEDIQTKRWYTRGFTRARISTFPTDPTFDLTNHYSVLTSRCSSTTAINQTIYKSWGITVRGHVIILRHAASNMMRVTNVPTGERRFIDFLVRSYFAYNLRDDDDSTE